MRSPRASMRWLTQAGVPKAELFGSARAGDECYNPPNRLSALMQGVFYGGPSHP
jgi:hypothetical protein